MYKQCSKRFILSVIDFITCVKKLEQELNDPKNIEAYEASVAELKNYEDFIAEETLAKRRNFVMANENIEDKDLALARVKEIKATITKLNRNISKFENLQPRIDKRVEKRAGVVAEAEQVLERGQAGEKQLA